MYSRSTSGSSYRIPEHYSGIAFNERSSPTQEEKPPEMTDSIPTTGASGIPPRAFEGEDLIIAAILFLIAAGKRKEGDDSVLLLLALLFFI